MSDHPQGTKKKALPKQVICLKFEYMYIVLWTIGPCKSGLRMVYGFSVKKLTHKQVLVVFFFFSFCLF